MARLAAEIGNTRSAAALELWRPHLAGAVVAIGNAPTALFHLLDMLDAGRAAAGRDHRRSRGLCRRCRIQAGAGGTGRVPFLIVHGRRGGSAMAVAAVNALASESE